MKQPDDPAIGGARKSLPMRKSRKVPKRARATKATSEKKKPRKRSILDKNVEEELVKVFGEK